MKSASNADDTTDHDLVEHAPDPQESPLIDVVPYRLEGVCTAVDIVRKSVEQVKVGVCVHRKCF